MNFDWQIQYRTLVSFLGNVLGKDYEIVLHDFSRTDNTIIAIVNEHVSGRDINTPASLAELTIIRNKEYINNPYILNYEGISIRNQQLRCSCFFIKGENGKLLGMLCINFNQQKYNQFAYDVMDFIQSNLYADINPAIPDNLYVDFIKNQTKTTSPDYEAIFYETLGVAPHTKKLNQYERIKFIRAIYNRGIFQVKGAVSKIASLTDCSTASIYRYLSIIKKNPLAST